MRRSVQAPAQFSYFMCSRKTAKSRSESMGFVRWSSMPASWAQRTSSSKASPVIAIIGKAAASGRSSARRTRVASYPSMTGMRMSMRIAAYVPGAKDENFSSPSRPFCAASTAAPETTTATASCARTATTARPRPTRRTLSAGGRRGGGRKARKGRPQSAHQSDAPRRGLFRRALHDALRDVQKALHRRKVYVSNNAKAGTARRSPRLFLRDFQFSARVRSMLLLAK